jgi:hypothetical protein
MKDNGAESVLNKLVVIAKAADAELERPYRPNELASGPRIRASPQRPVKRRTTTLMRPQVRPKGFL